MAQDGHSNNHSRNWGVEGETDDPEINATRDAVKRAMLAMMFVSAGTPMLLAGDEMNRTQDGNNNAYCQDNRISYLDWKRADTDSARTLINFTGRLIALRDRYETLAPVAFSARQCGAAPRSVGYRLVRSARARNDPGGMGRGGGKNPDIAPRRCAVRRRRRGHAGPAER